ncbi:MAG: M20/M25/M40 family metallo-hydrolase [Gemmatimonadetes bacterium]|nr:M20/M25/M40 family metallo-hydrolase [Gemmatimonadota bacterium]
MNKSSLRFLHRLLDAPGPSGFETAPAAVWRDEAAAVADDVVADVSGNSVAVLNPDGAPRVMLAGHIDEIGLMIVHVDDNGFLYFSGIGGWDGQVLVGQRVLVLSKRGTILGVIGKRAIHLIKTEDRDTASKISDLWIDIGARNRKNALKLVRVGDSAVIAGDAVELLNKRLVSRSIDNRIGAFVVLEALRLLQRRRPRAAVFAVATAQEETSWSGGGARTSAFGIEPTVAIVVDVTHASDCPGAEKKEVGDFKLGGGPVLSRGSAINPVVFEMLIQVAEKEKIAYAIQAAPTETGTDADAIYTTQRGVATGLVSIPNRYMHSPCEMIELADLDRAARLLAAFTRRLTAKTDFVPR